MRIVSRSEFMKLPAGTIYSNYEPCIFSGLHVTGGECGPDFLTCNLLDTTADEESSDAHFAAVDRMERGEDVPLEFGESFGREGLFDNEMLYAVWSPDDIRGLSAFLLKALKEQAEP